MKKFKEIAEQHREEGRFKPVLPKMVKNKANVTPRSSSDSANVKLKEEFDVCKTCGQDPCMCDDSFGFVNETKRMSVAVKLQRAFEREQEKSKASRERAQHVVKPWNQPNYNQSIDARQKESNMKKEETQQVDEIVKPDVKNDLKTLDPVSFVKKHGVKKGQAKSMAESSMAEKQAQKQYRDARKNDVPFDPPYTSGKKPNAVAGKFGQGYSTARHLARQAMNKVASKYKTPIKEEGEMSKKAQIVKSAAKKGKKSDSFCAEPVISKSEVKM